jgi:hypothetical protein
MSLKRLLAIVAGFIICLPAAVYAGQTVTYTYNALGRLVQSQIQTPGPQGGVVQTFQYDRAGNRQTYTVSGAVADTSVTLSMSNSVVNVTSAGAGIMVNVSDSSASGTVTFTENGVFLGSTWVASGVAGVILQGLPTGVHTITATYSGDGTHAPRTTTFTIRVQDIRWLPAVLDLLLSN